ncbi:ribonuclease H-like domain-containing protein [Cohnella zeiphila]|uniref:Ribonuclease H-like domain-containing protein n=1 Tax=Cohnella zeiphila TaxID=2761120 RepID=A0A7X0SI27_9BACL|nr:ribonuclease H-like domain-containing protein [Cohnella zeiphila]MBB6730347.1 ribonuclease H-like domain-containing protein [Cohnella zeiphila]
MSGGLRERLLRLKGQAKGEEAGSGEHGSGSAATAGRDDSAAGKPESRDYRDNTERQEPDLHPAFGMLGVRQMENEHGSFLLRRIDYPFDYRHGLYELGELVGYAPALEPVAARQNKTGRPQDGHPDAIRAERLIFLDTETTGLGVGAGNVPFMIGFAVVEPEWRRISVEQTLIRHPGEEKAMLHYLLGRMAGRTHLVTYNGRTFDWPVLANRFILNGWRRSGVEPGHLDFLHPSRALWRNTLASCRLSRIEEDRLGVERSEDVPGSLAPELYVRFLSDGDAGHLDGVYRHNERDVLTLVTLATHFGALLSGEEEDDPRADELPEGAEELYRTAAWLDKHGMRRRAERLFAALAARDDAAAARWWLPAGLRYKRLGQWEQAVRFWERSAEQAELAAIPPVDAHVELAMFYEHREKNPAAALRYAEAALELALRRPASAREREERDALRRRVERLRRKAGRL